MIPPREWILAVPGCDSGMPQQKYLAPAEFDTPRCQLRLYIASFSGPLQPMPTIATLIC